ncbi:hypothetical protein IW262DRAFT_1482243 [Armillaria fumosa]|nr:hypothetical protein IW262DRAFT_1482243 [Armillaria fumosa]
MFLNMAPIKVSAEPSISLFSLLLSTWGSGLSVFVCAVLFFHFCIYPYLPPMSPKGLVIQLRGSVEEANALFQEHGRLLLANAADIIIQLTRYTSGTYIHPTLIDIFRSLEADTCTLERVLLDDQRLSLTSYDAFVFYLRQEKYIWINAYRYRRKINALKNRMEQRITRPTRRQIDPLDADNHDLNCVSSNLYRQFLFQSKFTYYKR